jgi:hypothetical protein
VERITLSPLLTLGAAAKTTAKLPDSASRLPSFNSLMLFGSFLSFTW